jgi:hypothetical protein
VPDDDDDSSWLVRSTLYRGRLPQAVGALIFFAALALVLWVVLGR